MDFSFWAIEGEIIRLMMEERGESKVLVKAFSCGYQKGVRRLKWVLKDEDQKVDHLWKMEGL